MSMYNIHGHKCIYVGKVNARSNNGNLEASKSDGRTDGCRVHTTIFMSAKTKCIQRTHFYLKGEIVTKLCIFHHNNACIVPGCTYIAAINFYNIND